MPTPIFFIKLTFLSNTPLSIFSINANYLKTNKKNLKNFLYFLCLYNLLIIKNTSFIKFKKPKIIILPKLLKKFTLLRAPFRHKLTKKNYSLTRYKSIVVFLISLNKAIKASTCQNVLAFTEPLVKYFYWFETNVQHIYRIDLKIPFFIKKYKL